MYIHKYHIIYTICLKAILCILYTILYIYIYTQHLSQWLKKNIHLSRPATEAPWTLVSCSSPFSSCSLGSLGSASRGSDFRPRKVSANGEFKKKVGLSGM